MLFLVFLGFLSLTNGDYLEDREALLNYEEDLRLGSKIILNAKEKAANKILLEAKLKEWDIGFQDPGKFSAGKHFFEAKPEILKSEIFKIIQKVPKGALLHAHDSAMASEEYVYNLTYWEGAYGCIINERISFTFKPDDSCSWELVSVLREEPGFDDWLKKQLTLIVDDAHLVYPDINTVWSNFMLIFGSFDGLFTYAPIFKDYFRQVLEELYEDNVQYCEFRGTLPNLYDLDRTYTTTEVIAMYVEVLENFKSTHEDFINCRFIYAPLRNVEIGQVWDYLNIAVLIKDEFPDFIAGFDLVGQEDLGRPLIDFIEALQTVSMPTFYHSAETNWNGGSTDLNVVDAILLNTKRIGHGFGAIKHPAALKAIKSKSIALEVNPISNQVLKLVEDLRNHPANFWFAEDYPVVISNDDPSFWGAKGLSFDWYYAFMTFTSRDGDLRVLKQLALNSLNYSTLESDEYEKAILIWEEKWDEFLDFLLNKN